MTEKFKIIIDKSKNMLLKFKNSVLGLINRCEFLKKAASGIKKSTARCVAFIKKHKKESIVAVAVLLAVTVAIILILVISSNGGSQEPQGEETSKWGIGITENIPSFSETADHIEQSEAFVAAYYSNVTSEQVAEYIAQLDEQCGIKFENEHYPRSAVLEDKVIAIHYNVTEMRFSVTVVAKNNEEQRRTIGY